MNFKKIAVSAFVLLLIIAIHTNGQNIIRGIVVDSVSFTALSGVHIMVKNSIQGTSTNSQGFFSVTALLTDTLLFSLVGYSSVEIPLLFEEDGFLIRLHEKSNVLPEIIIKGTRLSPNDIIRTPRALPKPMSAGEGVFSPIDYFSKWQREKRKLLKLIQENDRTITYLRVVNDQEVRETLMEEHSLTEQAYYEWLVKFNQQSSNVLYSTNPQEIITSLKTFFTRNVR